MQNVERIPLTQVVENKGKLSLLTRLSLGAGSLLAVSAANAEDPVDFITVLTTKLQGVATGINSLYGVAILIVAAIITWVVLKRGANKV